MSGFLFWSISVGIICGAGLAQVAVILSVVVTLGILILDRMPVAKAPMILVVNATDLDAETAVAEVVRKYTKIYQVKSRNMTANSLDLVIELRTPREAGWFGRSWLFRVSLPYPCLPTMEKLPFKK